VSTNGATPRAERSAIAACQDFSGSYRIRRGVHALATEVDVEKGIEVRSSRYLQSIVELISRTRYHAAKIDEHSLQVERQDRFVFNDQYTRSSK